MTQKKVAAIITNRSKNKMLFQQINQNDSVQSTPERFTLFNAILKGEESPQNVITQVISERINLEYLQAQPVHWRDFEFDNQIISTYLLIIDDEGFDELIDDMDQRGMLEAGDLEVISPLLLLMVINRGVDLEQELNQILLHYLRSDLPQTAWRVCWRCSEVSDDDLFIAYFDTYSREGKLYFSLDGRTCNNHYANNYSFYGDLKIDLMVQPKPEITLISGEKPYQLIVTLIDEYEEGNWLKLSFQYTGGHAPTFFYVNYSYYYLKRYRR